MQNVISIPGLELGGTVAVLATGPSMTAAVAESLRAHPCIALTDAHELAPWAAVLYAHDAIWWELHPAAQAFAGVKVSGQPTDRADVCIPAREERIQISETHCVHLRSSGLAAIRLAVAAGAKRILLAGFDPQGGHFHAGHKPPRVAPEPTTYQAWEAGLNALAAELGASGIEVLRVGQDAAARPLPIHLVGMGGLGDSIYHRPLVATALRSGRPVYLTTPWPELFEDLGGPAPLHFVRPETVLRCQARNIARQNATRWSTVPAGVPRASMAYYTETIAARGIPGAMAAAAGFEPDGPMTWRQFKGGKRLGRELPAGKPIALIRPVTVRAEWRNEARAPRAEYIAQATAIARRLGFFTVIVADIDEKHEWAVPPWPEADLEYSKGELVLEEMLALAGRAAVLIGGVGWIVPAAIAARRPALVVLGGMGASNAPEKLVPVGAEHRITFLQPAEYCRCGEKDHDCGTKLIPDFEAKAEAALGRLLP
jgi:hypothetical protein